MARKTWSELKTTFADNTEGAITAGDMRDFVDSVSGHTAASAPGASNDNTQGFSPGSIWLDTTGPALWVCVSAATGAAVWTQGGGGMAAVNFSFNADGSAYYVAPEPMTLDDPITAGAGTITYAKALAASTDSFIGASLPVTLAAGDVLRVTVTGLTGYRALALWPQP